jgi:hypothetical protein
MSEREKVRDHACVSEAALESLVLDLLEWIAMRERTYEEVMSAWRTSCPRLPVWEEANDRGLVAREQRGEREIIGVTAEGRSFLKRRWRMHRLV